jgi:membrane-associated protease RseP (regulator of RpoE activity)
MRLFRRASAVEEYPPFPTPWAESAARPRVMRVPVLHLALLAITFITTSMAGAYEAGVDPLADFSSISAGFPFSITLLSILLVHEMGHYTMSRVHGVKATLPYFIPGLPFMIGTFGAFIRMKSPPRSRRALFDVGAAGPWAGFLLSIPAVYIGLRLSEVRPLGPSEGGLVLGDSILFSLLSRLALGVTGNEVTILLHPIALAGWFGLFVTFLNLLPVGQLDGGHVAYSMFGPRHRWVSRVFLLVILFLGTQGWSGWFFWAVLITILGLDHPPTMDWWTPLDGRRRLAAWLTVALFVLTFMPEPLSFSAPRPEFEGQKIPISSPAKPTRQPHGLILISGHPRSGGAPAHGGVTL